MFFPNRSSIEVDVLCTHYEIVYKIMYGRLGVFVKNPIV